MKSHALVGTSEDLGQHGHWRFTRESVIDPELILVFHDLYETAFAPLRTRSMARQVLDEEEFRQQMVDGAVTKYVAWTLEGDPVGLCTMTNQLATVPWISPEYFAARYPEHWDRGAVWYYGFTLAHPSQRHARFLDQMVAISVVEPLAQGAICAWDMCAFNAEELGFGPRLSAAFEQTTGRLPDQSDAQNYYTVDLS
jgi:hypothetical protein